MNKFLLFAIFTVFFSFSVNDANAANANLFVSAENSKFDNYMSGPQVIEVVVIDSDINDTDVAKGEPDVTVNGKMLRMVQAVDGNWYGYFADRNMALIADSTSGAEGKGIDFGYFCGKDDVVQQGTNPPVTFTDTAGFTVNTIPTGGINGTSAGGPIGNNICADIVDPAVGPSITNVVRESKEVNININKHGQIGVPEYAWPIIQLYPLNPTGNVVIQYNKGGGAQTTTLTFDTVDQFAGIGLDKTFYKRGDNVLLTITDLWLNIDPTDEDSWTFGTFNATTNYQVFDENGNSPGDLPSNAGPDNPLTLRLQDLMCEDNCVMNVNPDILENGFAITLQDNDDSRLTNVDGNFDFLIDPQNPFDWGTDGGNMNGAIPVTITEVGTKSGVFTSFDELIQSNIVISDDTNVTSMATVSYKQISISFISSLTDHLVIFENGSSSSSCNPCVSPTELTILQNQNVTWYNGDVAAHTVTSGNLSDGPNGIFASGFISPGDSFSFTFLSPGSFDYYDIIHPWITGVIHVTDLTPPEDADVIIEFDGHDVNCQNTNDCYLPQSLSIETGVEVVWFNSDVIDHDVTSGTSEIGPDGKFSSGTLQPGQEFRHTFNSVGMFPYYDTLHPWATGEIIVTPVFPPGTDVLIAPGSSVLGCEETDDCFIPSSFVGNIGDTIIWHNSDSAGHTVTSGTPGGGPDGKFDSGLINADAEFSKKFLEDGIFQYYDLLHPWMTGVITINPQDCMVPKSGNWIITQNCNLTSSSITPASVLVQNNSKITIPAGVTLTIPSGHNITIESGSGVLIKSTGNLVVLS